MNVGGTVSNKLIVKGIWEEGYGSIPKKVMKDNRLSVTAKAIYAYLCSFTGGGTTAFPTVKTICEDVGIKNQGTFYNHMNQLKELGFIKVEKHKSENGKFENNTYQIADELPYSKNCSTEEMLSNQHSYPYSNLPSMENWSTNNKELKDKEFKDIKEYKESCVSNQQNKKLVLGVEQQLEDYQTQSDLINQFIENTEMKKDYGSSLVNSFKKWSKNDFELFLLFYERVHFAHRSVVKEKGNHFILNESFTAHAEEYKEELNKVFYRAIMKHRQNLVKKDFNNYLFGTFKGTWEYIYEQIMLENQSQNKSVPPNLRKDT